MWVFFLLVFLGSSGVVAGIVWAVVVDASLEVLGGVLAAVGLFVVVGIVGGFWSDFGDDLWGPLSGVM